MRLLSSLVILVMVIWPAMALPVGQVAIAAQGRFILDLGDGRVVGPHDSEDETVRAAVAQLRPEYVGGIAVVRAGWRLDTGAGYSPDPLYSTVMPLPCDFLTSSAYGDGSLYYFNAAGQYNFRLLKTHEDNPYTMSPAGWGGTWSKACFLPDPVAGNYRATWSQRVEKTCWPGWTMNSAGQCVAPVGPGFHIVQDVDVALDDGSHFVLGSHRWSECPTGYAFQESTSTWTLGASGPSCGAIGVSDKDGVGQVCIGNPIDPATGIKHQREIDYLGGGDVPLLFERVYASSRRADWLVPGSLGIGWRHEYGDVLKQWSSNGYHTVAIYSTGVAPHYFTFVNGVWAADADSRERLEPVVDGGGSPTAWKLILADESTRVFDVAGRLVSVNRRGSGPHSLVYDGKGRLLRVIDAANRALEFQYDELDRIVRLIDPVGAATDYTYDSIGNLTTVRYPDGDTRAYIYNEPTRTQSTNLPHALTGIVASGTRTASFSYDTSGRATQTEHAGGVDRQVIGYGVTSGGAITATDPIGATRVLSFQNVLGVQRATWLGEACVGCGGGATGILYDAQGNPTKITNPNNLITRLTHDSRNREVVRVEADGTGLARTVTTTWHPTLRRPTRVDEPGRRTDYTWNAAGDLLALTLTDLATGGTRSWTWTYDAAGRVLSEDGPRTDVVDRTTFTYDAHGDLRTVTDPLGHTTTVTARDGHGRALIIVDANGRTTSLAYDSRGRLVSRTVGTETTTLSRDARGRLIGLALPGGTSYALGYDDADRLVRIQDSAGNHLDYTLDGSGNRTREEIFEVAGAKIQTLARTYSPLGRRLQEIGAAGQTTTYAYDAGGRLTRITDPLNHPRQFQYDSLDRLIKVLEPHPSVAGTNQGQVGLAYTARDDIAGITDPRNLSTNYNRDAFGNVLTLTSPDAGVTTATFDPAGNVLTRTDARGAVASTQWDALDRPTRIDYGDQTVAYTWDACANGIGRLCAVSDGTGGTAFAYDAQGRVTQRTQTTDGAQLNQSVSYDGAGRPAARTLPSGRRLTYGYDSQGRIAGIGVDGVPILSDVAYRPFGPVKAWTWGNGATAARSFDLDGRITGVTLGAGGKAYSFDAAGRITLVADSQTSASHQNHSYDHLDRLTKTTLGPVASPTATVTYGYDLTGNRTNRTVNGASTGHAIAATSNRLTGLTGATVRSFTWDAAGNLTGDGSATYTYDNAGRRTSATVAGQPWSYAYNAFGQRVRKAGPAGATTLFAYDEAGHLLGEYTAIGAPIREYVWLGDTPVAVLTTNGTATDIGYIHADHRNAPRLVTRASDNAIRWRWEAEAFGDSLPDENPAGAGVFTLPLRDPGQYFDGETGSHDNGFRTYRPALGRYDQSDPIGLAGGSWSTFAYVNGNPLNGVDPWGLCGPLTPACLWIAANAAELTVAAEMVALVATNTPSPQSSIAALPKTIAGAVGNTVAGTGGCAAAKGLANTGRAGKQARLRELANDDKLGSADRGWIKQELNSIERGQRASIRNPPGKDLAHERGREAAKGYDYSNSNLQDRDLHRLQHKYDDFGRANAERP